MYSISFFLSVISTSRLPNVWALFFFKILLKVFPSLKIAIRFKKKRASHFKVRQPFQFSLYDRALYLLKNTAIALTITVKAKKAIAAYLVKRFSIASNVLPPFLPK